MPPYYLLPLPGKASNLTVPKKEGLLPKNTGSGLHEALQLAVRTFSLNRLPVPTCDHQPRDLALFPFPGGMKITWYAADKTGFHMLHALFPSCRMR